MQRDCKEQVSLCCWTVHLSSEVHRS